MIDFKKSNYRATPATIVYRAIAAGAREAGAKYAVLDAVRAPGKVQCNAGAALAAGTAASIKLAAEKDAQTAPRYDGAEARKIEEKYTAQTAKLGRYAAAETYCRVACQLLGFGCTDHKVGTQGRLSCAQACMAIANGANRGEVERTCGFEKPDPRIKLGAKCVPKFQ